MEVKARDSVDAVKRAQKEIKTRFLQVWIWTLTVALLVGALIVVPNWRTFIAIGLALGAYFVQESKVWTMHGPCAGFVGDTVATRRLFVLDSKGRTRAWIGVEDEYGDEHGPRLVMYDEKGQARLALRLVREDIEQGQYTEEKHAELVENDQETSSSDQSHAIDPALVMFGDDGRIKLSLWEQGDYPSIEVEGEKGKAGISPNQIWVMNKNLKSESMEA